MTSQDLLEMVRDEAKRLEPTEKVSPMWVRDVVDDSAPETKEGTRAWFEAITALNRVPDGGPEWRDARRMVDRIEEAMRLDRARNPGRKTATESKEVPF